MNDRDHAVYEALLRVNRFAADHSGAFAPGSKAETDFLAAAALEADIVVDDFEPGTPASNATVAKNELIAAVREDLKAIAATARSIARDEPGFDVDFRLGDDTQRETISTGQAFLARLGDPATVAKFTAYSMDPAFVTDLQADLTAISTEKGDQTDDRTGSVGETAATRAQIRQARDLIASLNTSVRNKFRNDPVVLAEWSTASRIHQPARNLETPPPAPPTP